MNFNIILFKGTESIKFGMRHNEVRAILGKEPILFKKSEFDIYMTECYTDICHVYYDDSLCVAFEFLPGAKVIYNSIQLISQELKSLESLFCDLEGYQKVSDSLSAFGGDFAIWGRFDHVESVYISRKGYSIERHKYLEKKYAEKYSI